MSSGWEKSVKGATKIKLAAPKSKYIEHILVATHTGEAGVAEVFRALQNRLRDSTWTIVFKGLIVVHLMLREGQEDVTLKYLANSPQRKLAINNFTEVQTQGRNIRTYADYLTQRAQSYSSTKVDYVRKGEGRLKNLTIDKGLLREAESVQEQIRALLRCDFFHSHEPENEITLTAFRLLTMDLLALFHVMNEGTISVLEHFFEMSKPDAERALKIYRSFVKQTDQVVRYLSIARHYEHATRLEIPKIKHAPTSLSSSLEEYLKDSDFEINRRQYLAQQESKKGNKIIGNKPFATQITETNGSASKAASSQVESRPAPKGPAPDLIDFFESIEQNQQQMVQATYQQPQFTQGTNQYNPFLPQTTPMPIQQQMGSGPVQNTNPFLQMPQMPQQQAAQLQQQQQQQQQAAQLQQQQVSHLQQQPQVQPNFTGAGFNGYGGQAQQQSHRFTPTLQTVPQTAATSFQSPTQQPYSTGTASDSSVQSTNPFRQSMLANSTTGTSLSSFASSTNSPFGNQPTTTNPFARPVSSILPPGQSFSPSPFNSSSATSYSPVVQSPMQPPNPIGSQTTGSTNPFSKPPVSQAPNPFSAAPVASNPTGSTNPFRQSAFVNQNTGMGWQNSAAGTIGGMSSNQVETVPVFPRPGMS